MVCRILKDYTIVGIVLPTMCWRNWKYQHGVEKRPLPEICICKLIGN
jgi:hypothetical protein